MSNTHEYDNDDEQFVYRFTEDGILLVMTIITMEDVRMMTIMMMMMQMMIIKKIIMMMKTLCNGNINLDSPSSLPHLSASCEPSMPTPPLPPVEKH